MTERPTPELSVEQENFLNRAYYRILKLTILLESTTVAFVLVWFGWKAALGACLGGAVAYINLRWLHRGTEQVTARMLAAAGKHVGVKTDSEGKNAGEVADDVDQKHQRS